MSENRTQPDEPEIAYPLKTVADNLTISLPTLYREVKLGRLRLCKIGGRSMVFRSDYEAYIRLLKDEAGK